MVTRTLFSVSMVKRVSLTADIYERFQIFNYGWLKSYTSRFGSTDHRSDKILYSTVTLVNRNFYRVSSELNTKMIKRRLKLLKNKYTFYQVRLKLNNNNLRVFRNRSTRGIQQYK